MAMQEERIKILGKIAPSPQKDTIVAFAPLVGNSFSLYKYNGIDWYYVKTVTRQELPMLLNWLEHSVTSSFLVTYAVISGKLGIAY